MLSKLNTLEIILERLFRVEGNYHKCWILGGEEQISAFKNEMALPVRAETFDYCLGLSEMANAAEDV